MLQWKNPGHCIGNKANKTRRKQQQQQMLLLAILEVQAVCSALTTINQL